METGIVNVEEAQKQALTWPERAQSIQIVDQPSYDTASGWVKDIKEIRKRVAEHHDPMIKAAHATHREAVSAKKRFDDALAEAEKILKQGIGSFAQEQERKRLAAQRAVEEEARKREDEERLRKAEKIEESGGSEAQVDEVLAAPSTAPKPAAPPSYTQTKGISTRDNWKGEVEDLKALIKAVSEGKAPITFLQANQSAINQMAKATKGAVKYDGVRIYNDAVVFVRS